ncbi:accessory factor UbiK family protein [Halomonas sp. NO4]|uniref:accessory factor UbiK family protein n=1 Tax=Halomonas sp. NO4 TaxID=2484813 RepID=UPI0013D11790|nr:accessory factor UbiK family protein [Halomonas sp. NO4]
MSRQDPISRLAQQLGERLQGASQGPEELQKAAQQVVRGAFDRLELVSREDFDILMDVLQRTRSRVEALEQQVAALEEVVAAQREMPPSLPGAADETSSAKDDGKAPEEDAGAGETDR